MVTPNNALAMPSSGAGNALLNLQFDANFSSKTQ
jgi:hypothetical protein